jgi:hypothetical protein
MLQAEEWLVDWWLVDWSNVSASGFAQIALEALAPFG